MSVRSIIDSLPNGLHDSYLKEMRLDFSNKDLVLELDIWIDEEPNSENKFDEKYRKGVLKLKDIKYIKFDQQCFNTLNFGELSSAWVEVGYGYSNIPKPDGVTDDDNSGWIFFNDLNGFVHFCCSESIFKWV